MWPRCQDCGRDPCECWDDDLALAPAHYDADELGLDPEEDDTRA